MSPPERCTCGDKHGIWLLENLKDHQRSIIRCFSNRKMNLKRPASPVINKSSEILYTVISHHALRISWSAPVSPEVMLLPTSVDLLVLVCVDDGVCCGDRLACYYIKHGFHQSNTIHFFFYTLSHKQQQKLWRIVFLLWWLCLLFLVGVVFLILSEWLFVEWLLKLQLSVDVLSQIRWGICSCLRFFCPCWTFDLVSDGLTRRWQWFTDQSGLSVDLHHFSIHLLPPQPRWY